MLSYNTVQHINKFNYLRSTHVYIFKWSKPFCEIFELEVSGRNKSCFLLMYYIYCICRYLSYNWKSKNIVITLPRVTRQVCEKSPKT
jgi:hypothetical protein